MRGNAIWILCTAVLASALPQPARFDQRQTGTYNLHVNLQNGQVYAVVKDMLMSAPVRNFAVTLKGPLASEAPRTEAPRTGPLLKNVATLPSTQVPTATTPSSPAAAAVGDSNSGNNTSSRRQNNKVASQIILQPPAELPAPPPPVQTAKPTPSALPPLPQSIIAALTEHRTIHHRYHGYPAAELNEVDKKN